MVLYAAPWNTRDSVKFIRENFFGLYSWVVGTKLSMEVRDIVLPQMKHLLSEEDYKAYKKGLDNNR